MPAKRDRSRLELQEQQARDFAMSCAQKALILRHELKAISGQHPPQKLPESIKEAVEQLRQSVRSDRLLPALATRLGKARAAVGPYQDGNLCAATAHEAAISLAGDTIFYMYSYQEALDVHYGRSAATLFFRDPEQAEEWLRYETGDVVGVSEQVRRLQVAIEWEFRQVAPITGKAKGPDDLQTDIMKYLGNCTYQIGDSRPVKFTAREDSIFRSFLRRPAMDSSQLATASGYTAEAAAKVLRAVKQSKYSRVFGPAITMPGGRGRGGYHVRITDEV